MPDLARVMLPCAVQRGAEHVHAISVLLLALDGLRSCFGESRPQHETRISAETVAGCGAKGGKRPGSRDRSIAQVDESRARWPQSWCGTALGTLLIRQQSFGASQVMMFANGFTRQMLARLIRTGLATTQRAERQRQLSIPRSRRDY